MHRRGTVGSYLAHLDAVVKALGPSNVFEGHGVELLSEPWLISVV